MAHMIDTPKTITSGYWKLILTSPVWPSTQKAISSPIINVWYSQGAEGHNPRLALCQTDKGYTLLDESDHGFTRTWKDIPSAKRFLRSLE